VWQEEKGGHWLTDGGRLARVGRARCGLTFTLKKGCKVGSSTGLNASFNNSLY
jgi:hypothetical protein